MPINRKEDARELTDQEKLSPLDQGVVVGALDKITAASVIREYIGNEEYIEDFRQAIIEDASIGHKRFLDVVRWYNSRFPDNPILIPSDKYLGRSIADMQSYPLHKSEIIIGDETSTLLTKGARVCVYAQPKAAKTTFTIQLGLDLASGGIFLERYRVARAHNVLYLNFELDAALFEERIMLVKNALGYQTVPNFKQLTLLGKDIPLLDTKQGYDQLKAIIEMHKSNGFPVEILVLDCRWKTFQKSDNEGDVMRTWLGNVEALQNEFHFIPIIIHHEGKSTTGMGAGSSNFDRWVNTAIQIQAIPGESTRTIRVYGNYTGVLEIPARLEYPIHKIAANLEAWHTRRSKKEEACDFILATIRQKQGQIDQQELERLAVKREITEDTLKRALNELEQTHKITKSQDPNRAGRHNIIKLGEEGIAHL